MRINNIDNSQNFKSVYRVRATAENIKLFEEKAAPVYRSINKKGIRAFVRKVSEMYVMTDKDAYDFDKRYLEYKREKLNKEVSRIQIQKKGDTVIHFGQEDFDFVNNFVRSKRVAPINGFRNLLIKIFD